MIGYDFNDDGILDLVTANYGDNNVGYFSGSGSSGKGNGQFTTSGTTITGDGPQHCVVGRYNSDNIDDIAVADRNGGTVSILLGNAL